MRGGGLPSRRSQPAGKAARAPPKPARAGGARTKTVKKMKTAGQGGSGDPNGGTVTEEPAEDVHDSGSGSGSGSDSDDSSDESGGDGGTPPLQVVVAPPPPAVAPRRITFIVKDDDTQLRILNRRFRDVDMRVTAHAVKLKLEREY